MEEHVHLCMVRTAGYRLVYLQEEVTWRRQLHWAAAELVESEDVCWRSTELGGTQDVQEHMQRFGLSHLCQHDGSGPAS